MLLRREQIRWEQIDPRISARVGAFFAQTRSNDASANRQETNPVVREGFSMQQGMDVSSETLGFGWTLLSFTGAVFLVFLFLNASFNLTGAVTTAVLSALPVGLVGITTMAGMVDGGRRNGTPRLRGSIAPLNPHLRQAFMQSATTRAEQLYADMILHLAAITPTTGARESSFQRDLLQQCNALLTDHFRIETHRQRIFRLKDTGNALAQAEREEARLVSRRDAEVDPIARRSFTESLEMCRERIEAVRALDPMLARLEAHDELICQALSLAKAALTRLEAAPVALLPPDVEGLRTTVRHVLDQTHAVEEAIAELSHHTV